MYDSIRMRRVRRPFKIYQTNTQTATDNVGQAQWGPQQWVLTTVNHSADSDPVNKRIPREISRENAPRPLCSRLSLFAGARRWRSLCDTCSPMGRKTGRYERSELETFDGIYRVRICACESRPLDPGLKRRSGPGLGRLAVDFTHRQVAARHQAETWSFIFEKR